MFGWRERAPPGPRVGLSPPLLLHELVGGYDDLLSRQRGPLVVKGDVMHDLPARPDLSQLRRQAKDLLDAAKSGDPDSLERIGAVSQHLTLASAQLSIARYYGFASWPAFKREVERREIFDDRDVGRLTALLAEAPELATTSMERWCDHPQGASPIGYVAMLRYDTARGAWREMPGTGALVRELLRAGAPANGHPGEPETPLITAASYGDAEVARELIDAGADLEVRASDSSGGVPGGTALLHAAVFGMTEVVDVLAEAGARIHSIEEAAAVGDISGWLDDAPADARLRALVMAADHQRLDVLDELIAAGTPVDGTDEAFGGHPLRTAAWNARPLSVRRLLEHGANPNLRDDQGRTPLALCRQDRGGDNRPERDEVEAILAPLTSDESAERSSAAVQAPARVDAPPMLEVEIRGSDLPGLRCGPDSEGRTCENVHVGLARKADTVELRPGDARTVSWRFEITVRRDAEGRLDFGGPFVYGGRGERSLGLRWGTLGEDDAFDVFRAAKLRLADVDPELVDEALREGRRLVCRLGLTDEHGWPRCASVRPPDVTWSISRESSASGP
jgi:Family of unknown function (DUF5990)/Ankyrin repeats (3 copies)/Ankyrin repeats (many copies)